MLRVERPCASNTSFASLGGGGEKSFAAERAMGLREFCEKFLRSKSSSRKLRDENYSILRGRNGNPRAGHNLRSRIMISCCEKWELNNVEMQRWVLRVRLSG